MNAIDTNVLVYAVSGDEPIRAPRALALLERLSRADTVLLWQVACEFGGVLGKLRARGKVVPDVAVALGAWRTWFQLVLPNEGVLDLGLRLHREQGISYWDALLLAACADAGVDTLYSEDRPGQPVVRGVRVVNPFA